MEPITTITFFRYGTLWSRIWAFGMMQFAHSRLTRVAGLQFYKLMGSGKARFNPWPDWSVYSLVQVWENEKAAETFFAEHPLMEDYRKKVVESWTLYMRTLKVKGQWNAKNPFPENKNLALENDYLAIITRATIKTKFLLKFWKYVPASQEGLLENAGLLYNKGIGEIPFRNMATFSLWTDRESLQKFAYGAEAHKKAISLTHKLQWYKEELFARFQPYRSEGSWKGVSIPEFES